MVYTPSALNFLNPVQAGSALADPRMDEHLLRRTADDYPKQAYDISYLGRMGEICQLRQVAPDLPLFQAAFTAFARGTLIATASGPVAVEDLLPGDKIITNERGPSPLMWVGSITLRPAEREGPSLTRITSAALGLGRPLSDLMTGPGARILQRIPGMAEQVLRPVRDMLDGMQVIELRPPSAVQLYHIALRRHATVTAAGLAMETFHPGPGFENTLPYQHFDQFMALFPHVARPSDFGPLAHPRQPLQRARG
ncbi:Hint domain-containing protein [Roseovarius sp. LXJ103]|uniref:Hint domain-containing protein n=1 Tax=Roseovarius carneus TaxID=2853164 RepID=UPI000D61311E|nr:Hint domain-containing protein [Roseovarius carneus]MBZ8117415.1 Hint domain-containing protein [Roseovarius carneus]PWE36775.1 hypothetical protein DD563_12915 [Pelagicola sp. LXJ1103]